MEKPKANVKAIEDLDRVVQVLVEMQAFWWKEVYKFGMEKYNGDRDKAAYLATHDAQNQKMLKALKGAGVKL